MQVLHAAAAKGEVGGAGGAWPEGKGGAKSGDSEEQTLTAGEPAAENRSGQVPDPNGSVYSLTLILSQ